MSRLYPGFGSGKKPYEAEFEAKCFAADTDELSCGDKVILPQSALKEIRRLRLPLPLLFEITSVKRMRARKAAESAPSAEFQSSFGRASGGGATRTGSGRGRTKSSPRVPRLGITGSTTSSTKSSSPQQAPKKTRSDFRQFCGVLEFSAPPGVCLLPKWMMRNLRIKEGSKVHLISQRDPPKGEFARFRPHKTAFVDLAAALGPREVMEAAMRFFSVLSVGETVQVSVAGERFLLDVLDVKPGRHVCLYGDLDLEVDFAPPKDAPGGAGAQEMDDGGISGREEKKTAEGHSGHTGRRMPSARGAAGLVRGLRQRTEEAKVVEKPVEVVSDVREENAARWAMKQLRERRQTTSKSTAKSGLVRRGADQSSSASPIGIIANTSVQGSESDIAATEKGHAWGRGRTAASGKLVEASPTRKKRPPIRVTPPRTARGHVILDDEEENDENSTKKPTSISPSKAAMQEEQRAKEIQSARRRAAQAAMARRAAIARKRAGEPPASPVQDSTSEPLSPVRRAQRN